MIRAVNDKENEMHIVFAVIEYPNIGKFCGGLGNYVSNMAHILKSHNHEVDIVVESDETKTLVVDDITIHILDVNNKFKSMGKEMNTVKKLVKNIYRSIRYNQCIKKINATNKIDLVQYASTYGLILFRLSQIPSLLRMSEHSVLHRTAFKNETFDLESALKEKRLDEEVITYSYRRADKIIAPSYLVANIAEKKAKCPVDVVESPFFLPLEKPYDEKQKKTMLEGKKYLFYFGQLSARKEAHIIALIIKSVLAKYKDLYLVIAGNDREIPFDSKKRTAIQMICDMAEEYKSRIVYLGKISDRDEITYLIRNSYACLLPTRTDNLPNTCIEAMGAGKIVISTNGTSAEQLITDGINGFLGEIDDADSLRLCIDKLMDLSLEEKRCMEGYAKSRITRLNPDAVYEKMMKVYQETIYNWENK